MSGLLIEVRVLGGHPIRDAIADMCRLADKLGITVAANCNDVRVVAPPRSDDYALFLNWERGRDRAEKETGCEHPADARMTTGVIGIEKCRKCGVELTDGTSV